jgi:hypothetical protein
VLSGTDSEESLEVENPDLILGSVAELLDLDFSEIASQATTLE